MVCTRLLSLVAICTLGMPAAFAGEVDTARRGVTVDQTFGLTMPDPYRWMEGEGNAEFDTWLKAQGKQTRTKLDALPTLDSWRQRLSGAAGAGTRHGAHRRIGDRLFYTRAVAGKERALVMRDANGRERVIFDPSTEAGTSINNYSPSPDASKVTINIGRAGNETGEVALYDVASGKRLGDTLKPVWSEFNPSWLPDGSGFFYTRMREAGGNDPLQGMGAYLHRLGEPQAKDRSVALADGSAPLKIAAHDFPIVDVYPGSQWLMLGIVGARSSGRACFTKLEDLMADKAAWRCLVDDDDLIQGADVFGDTAYLLQAKDAPNRRVLGLNLADPQASLANARVVVPERKDMVLTTFSPARDGLYLKSMHRGLDRIERLDYEGGALQPIAMPFEGSVYLMRTHPLQDGALLSLEGWTEARKVYQFDPRDGQLKDTGLGTITAMTYPSLVSEEIEAISADGTRIPLSVIRRKDLHPDGSARALVNGYGGYGESNQPVFLPVLLEWAKAGNVLADCHVRGGGENGESWRLGGQGANKQRGVEDYIACAQELAKRGYSSAPRTAGIAASMGGVLAGGAYTTAPETYGAMVLQAGIINAVRLLEMKNGANQVAEMGDPRTVEGLRQLFAMDPYQRVKDGTDYPPLLLMVGLADQRVVPWNSGKFGARVLHAAPDTGVWFRTDEEFGHFATSDGAQAQEFADIFAFLDAQLTGP